MLSYQQVMDDLLVRFVSCIIHWIKIVNFFLTNRRDAICFQLLHCSLRFK